MPNGVAVNNDSAKICRRPGEFFPDPHQVLRVLAVEGNAGANTRVDEEIVARMKGQGRFPKKPLMDQRHGCG